MINRYIKTAPYKPEAIYGKYPETGVRTNVLVSSIKKMIPVGIETKLRMVKMSAGIKINQFCFLTNAKMIMARRSGVALYLIAVKNALM